MLDERAAIGDRVLVARLASLVVDAGVAVSQAIGGFDAGD